MQILLQHQLLKYPAEQPSEPLPYQAWIPCPIQIAAAEQESVLLRQISSAIKVKKSGSFLLISFLYLLISSYSYCLSALTTFLKLIAIYSDLTFPAPHTLPFLF